MKIRKGDNVIVITGNDKGAIGTVTRAIPKNKQVIVDSVNVKSRHTKPMGNNTGGIIKKEMPIDVSNVAAYCAKKKIKSKIGYKFVDGKKVRFLKVSDTII